MEEVPVFTGALEEPGRAPMARKDLDRTNNDRSPLGADLIESNVSLYFDPTDIVGRAEKLSVVLLGIKAGHWEKPTVAIRKARECGDMALADRLKKALPAFTASGVFAPSRKKTNWVKPTGLLFIDIDGLESRERAEAVRDVLGRDPHVLAAFISVSEKGVKAIVFIGAVADAAEFTSAWRAFAAYLKQKYGETKIAQTQQYVDIAVRAAEQLFKTEQAQEKKAYVVNYLSERGIKFDSATIENMIESSVLLLHNELYGTKQEENK